MLWSVRLVDYFAQLMKLEIYVSHVNVCVGGVEVCTYIVEGGCYACGCGNCCIGS